ncbi:hypothetical protein KUTG_10112 [Kutzneria sp. 744]|nr:hypothetical protein KUTG_10112 [Kutzneria sp. 744]
MIKPESVQLWLERVRRDVPEVDADLVLPITNIDTDYSPRIEATMQRRGWGTVSAVATNALQLVKVRGQEWSAMLSGEVTAEQLELLRWNGAYENHTELLDELTGFDGRYWRVVVDDIGDLGARWLDRWGSVDADVWERAARELTVALVRPGLRPAVEAWHDAWWPANRASWTDPDGGRPSMRYRVTRDNVLAPVLGMAVIVGSLVAVLPQRDEVAEAVLELINRTIDFIHQG